MAETLSKILDSHVAHGASAKDKVLGAAFIVVNKDGTPYPFPSRPSSRLISLTPPQESSTNTPPAAPASRLTHPPSQRTPSPGSPP